MRSFKVGDRVMLRETSKYYGDVSQGDGKVGKIINTVGGFGLPYTVRWDGYDNSYSHFDLRKVNVSKYLRLCTLS